MANRRIPAEQTPKPRVPKKVSGTYPRPKPIGIPDRPSDVGLAPKLPPTQEKPPNTNTYGVPSDALPYLGPQLSLIQSQEDARRQALGEYTKAVLAELGKFAPQIGSDYDTAIGQSRSLAQAGSDSLRQANGNTDIQSILQAANAPAAQQQQVAANLGNVFNGGGAALFGQQGVFPGQQLIRDKAAAQAFANDLPGINALAGTAALKNLLYQSGVDRQKVLGQIPSILSDIAKQKADAGYRQATLAQGQQRIDLSAKNEKRQLANDAFGQWAKTVSLKQGNQRLSMQSAQQQFNQWAKRQGLDVAWANVDLSQRRLAVSQAKASKQSKPAISKTDLRNARSFLFQNRNGYWAYTTDPEAPISAAEARRAQALDPKSVIKTGVAEHEDNEIQRIYETLTTKYGIPARRAFDMVANQYKAWGTAHRSAYFPKGSAAQGAADYAAYVTVAPTANRAGAPLNPSVADFVGKIGSIAGRKLTIGTGTNHNEYVVGTKRMSAHWVGNAADVPASGAELTRLGQDALIAAGMPAVQARRQKGGLYNVGGYQIIFNSMEGGNHFNHLHVGLTV